MKKRISQSLIVSLLLILSITVETYALEAFNITNYQINMEVKEDNSYWIKEYIRVEFDAQRHGIIRNIPLRTYRNKPASISNVSVEGHKFTSKKAGQELNIKIGDPNKYANQVEDYIISYKYTIGDDRLRDMDELYWNLIGLDWDCNISNISFQIQMPKNFPQDRLNFTYGRKGATSNEGILWNIEGNTIYGSLAGSLGPHEALTVALPLPEGYYSQVKTVNPVKEQGLGITYLATSLLAGLGIWILFGKKKQSFPTVEFYPPQGITSADAGFLIDGSVDPKDISSLIIYWADQGYLNIREYEEKKVFKMKKSFALDKIRDLDPDARDYEHLLFRHLFSLGNGKSVNIDQLSNRFYTAADTAKGQIVDSFQAEEETRIFTKSNTWSQWLIRLIGLIAGFPTSYMIMQDLDGNQGIKTFMQASVMSLLLMSCLMACTFILFNWKNKTKKGKFKELLFATGFTTVVGGVYLYTSASAGNLVLSLATILIMIVLGILSLKCNRRTELGVWYEEKLVGFREFLKATELDRIKLLVDKNPHYFYNVLPYAMVLGVTDKWAKNFDGIMTEPPDWYHPIDSHRVFSPYSFATEMERNMRSMSDTMYMRPSSSSGGSSSGGSSGGGSGGGGGSSW